MSIEPSSGEAPLTVTARWSSGWEGIADIGGPSASCPAPYEQELYFVDWGDGAVEELRPSGGRPIGGDGSPGAGGGSGGGGGSGPPGSGGPRRELVPWGGIVLTHTYQEAGSYRVRIKYVDNGSTTYVDLRGVSPGPPNPNRAPVVSAGADIGPPGPFAGTPVLLRGEVRDDGPPAGRSVASAWTQLSGPAQARFERPDLPTSVASFPAAGQYVLRLTASDGALSASDDVLVTVRRGLLSPESKRSLQEASRRSTQQAEVLGALGAGCIFGSIRSLAGRGLLEWANEQAIAALTPILNEIPTDPCSVALAAASGYVYLTAAGFGALANDPPDPRYSTIAWPRVPPVPRVVGRVPQGARAANALNALFRVQAVGQALEAAVLHAIERSQGAAAVGDAAWEARQLAAARAFAFAASLALRYQPPLARSARLELERAGVAPTPISAGEIAETQARLRGQGLPPGVAQLYALSGIGPEQQAALVDAILAAPPGTLATTFPAALDDPGALAALEASASLAAFARMEVQLPEALRAAFGVLPPAP